MTSNHLDLQHKKMKILAVFCVLLVELPSSAAQDQTLRSGAHGPEVVDAVVNRIRGSCLFPDFKLFLRRLAYVATHDGDNPQTLGFEGGIWQVGEHMFNQINESSKARSLYQSVLVTFRIDWSAVQWLELRKPLYSGLASALYLYSLHEDVPRSITDQARFYGTYFNNGSTSAATFTERTKRFNFVCQRTDLDLAFLVDASSSLSPEDFKKAKDFAHKVVQDFKIGAEFVRVAFVTFSTGYKSEFDFDAYLDKPSLLKAVDEIRKAEGKTDTDLALDFATKKLFTPSMGSRDGSSKVILLITDGKSSHKYKTIPAALRARHKGIVIFTIGVGSDVERHELVSVANSPQCTHVIQLEKYSDLDSFVAQMQQVSCREPADLKYGEYTFPCSKGGLFQIRGIDITTQVTLTSTDGIIDIYGSLSNPAPNKAGHKFYSNAISRRQTVILVSNPPGPLYLNVSAATDQNGCTGNYTIKVGDVEKVKPTSAVTCLNKEAARQCSVVDVYAQLYKLLVPPYSRSIHCPVGVSAFKPHPTHATKFIYCDHLGNVFVFMCHAHQVFNSSEEDCVRGEAPTPSTTSASSLPQTSPTLKGFLTTSKTTFKTSSSSKITFPSNTVFKTMFPTSTSTLAKSASPKLNTVQRTHSSTTITRFTPESSSIGATSKHVRMTTMELRVHSTIQTARNPCSKYDFIQGHVFYPFPGDRRRFIQCDVFGVGYVLTCPDQKLWYQDILQCIHQGLVIDKPSAK